MAPVVFAQLINALWHIDADLWGPSTPSNKGPDDEGRRYQQHPPGPKPIWGLNPIGTLEIYSRNLIHPLGKGVITWHDLI
jgi:hypothetical protein